MNFRIIGFPALLLLTAGCSSLPSMHSLLSYGDDSAVAQPTAVAAMPAEPAPPGPPDWCQRLGADARAQAAASGFDAATQERMSQQSSRQCVTLGQGGSSGS